jgi:acetyltransferase-like isoleucine patch superfamily enzyme/glycosyltransferase involved in cell wall biosynthesis
MLQMKGKDIIVIGIQPWDIEIGSNCKNIAEAFSQDNRVLYINTPLDRKSRFTERNSTKTKKRLAVLKGKLSPIEQINPGLWVLNPKTILESINFLPDGRLFDWVNRINNVRLAKEILKAIRILGFKNYYLFNDSSMFNGFYQKELLRPALSIYYMRDYLIKNPFWKKHGIRLEPILIRKSHLVVNNSNLYTEYGRKHNPHSYMVGQGCDVDSYNQDKHVIDIAADLQGIPNPIIGYVGFLSTRRLNLELMEKVAESRPDWSMVLVGPEDDGFKASKLHGMSNVFFLGSKRPDELPGYIQGFDVCLNPQRINDATIGNYPRKIDEYLAMGKPTVATSTIAMDFFKEFTYLGESAEDYVVLIERALVEDCPELRRKRTQFASAHTWENNVLEISKVVDVVQSEMQKLKPDITGGTSGLKSKLKADPRLQKIAMWVITPVRRPRPRWFIRLFINRFFHKRGKNSLIRRPSRMDVFPYNRFELGENSTIESYTVVNNGAGNVIFGDRVRIGIGSVIIGPVEMGNGSGLGQHVFISGFNHGYKDGTKNSSIQALDIRPVSIGEESHIGANSVILAGCSIGKRCQIGAGSVVTKSIPDFSIAVGNPARVIKQYNVETKEWERV